MLLILNIPDLHGMRYVNLCFHKDKFFTPLMEEFLEHFERCTQQMMDEGLALYTKANPNLPQSILG